MRPAGQKGVLLTGQAGRTGCCCAAGKTQALSSHLHADHQDLLDAGAGSQAMHLLALPECERAMMGWSWRGLDLGASSSDPSLQRSAAHSSASISNDHDLQQPQQRTRSAAQAGRLHRWSCPSPGVLAQRAAR